MTVPTDARTAALLADVEQLSAALDRAGERMGDAERGRAASLLDGVRGRLELGVGHTIIALVGGTGSGKSSLFNALSGLTFADVGVRRPTTSAVSACVWAHDADALLDWLGVERARRIERESELDGESQADLRGLVLLDLPDHDSVEAAHHAVVDRLVPQADLLVWVVDPQKYADNALHSQYLAPLGGHEAGVVMVLNQLDTVPTGARESLLSDVARLIREDGLADVEVFGVSAATKEGLGELRARFATLVNGRSVSEARAANEIAEAAAVLKTSVGSGEPAVPTEQAVEALAQAAGVSGVCAAVAGSGALEPTTQTPTLGPVQADRVALVREAWLTDAVTGLPERWASAVESAVGGASDVVRAVDAALDVVEIPRPVHRVAAAVWVPWVAGLLAVGAVVAAVAVDPLFWAAAALAVLVAVVVPWTLQFRRRSRARASADALAVAARDAIAAALDSTLVAPGVAVLEEHRAVRLSVAAVLAELAINASTDHERSTDSEEVAVSTS